MSEKVEPALSPEAWEWIKTHPAEELEWPVVGTIPGMIAAHNFYLPGDHPQKIKREDVDLLREIAKEYRLLSPLADALDSYLPADDLSTK